MDLHFMKMEKTSFIPFIAILLLLLTQDVNSYTCRQYVYNYTMLVLDWPAQFCYHHQTCKQNWRELVTGDQFIIKGFWPASSDIDFLNCLKYAGHDPNCNVAYNYDDNSFNSSLKTDLSTFWPQITVSNDIKQGQWNQHGTCYISIVQTLNATNIGNEMNIFVSYFKETVQKAKRLHLSVTRQQFKTKGELALSLGVQQNQFHALCEYDNDFLSQIRICYNIKGKVGTQTLTGCTDQQPNECEFPVKFRAKNHEGYLLYTVGLILIIFALLH